MFTLILTNTIFTDARALTTSGTRPSPAAVMSNPIEMPANVMPNARNFADPDALTVNRDDVERNDREAQRDRDGCCESEHPTEEREL